MKSRKLLWTIALCLSVSMVGCSLVNISKDDRQYQRSLPGLPKDKEMSFPNKRAMAAGASLANVTAAQGYYEGFKAKSKEAKLLYDLTFRFMGLCGVNMAFDPTDPDSIEKVFKEADNAVQEKEKNIADLKQQVQDFTSKLAEKEEIVRDKGAELKSFKATWKARLGSLFWGILVSVILIVVGLGAVQVYTGFPVLTGLVKTFIPFAKGGITTLFKLGKQTAVAIDKWKDTVVTRLEALRNSSKETYTREEVLALLEEQRQALSKHLGNEQDADAKIYLKKMGVNA